MRLSAVLFGVIVLFSNVAVGQSEDYLDRLDTNETHEAYRVLESDEPLVKLRKRRINALMMAAGPLRQRVMDGSASVLTLGDLQKMLLDAQMEFHQTNEERVVVLDEALKSAKEIEDAAATRFEAGIGRPDSAAFASAFRIEIEIRQLELQDE